MIRLLFFSFLSMASVCAVATEQSLRPGGIAILDIGAASEEKPVASMNGRRLLVTQRNQRWITVAGIPLDTSPGDLQIEVGGKPRNLSVASHAYREQRLTVTNKSYVSPDQDQLDRVFRERKIIDAALSNFRDTRVDGVSLSAPVEGARSSSFGLRRFFNDQPRSPHKGMDIAAGEGEPIAAPKGGIVTAIGDYFFNGNTVIVDHGQGFVTMYCHLSEITVIEGQALQVGEMLGAVGATGRVTGPHLHFGAYLNGTAVDPSILIVR